MVDARNRMILTYLIKMLHDLHYQVIAEGVEDQATFDEVAALGFDGAQGFISPARCRWRRLVSLWQR